MTFNPKARVMRIMLITQDFPPKIGGIEVYSYQLANEWHKMGIEVIVLTVSQKKQLDLEQSFDSQLPYEVARISVSNPILLGHKIKQKLASLVQRYRVSHVFHSQWQTALPSLKLKKQGKIAQVSVAVHGRELLHNPYEYVPLIKSHYTSKRCKVFKKCDYIFSNSHFVANLVHQLPISEDTYSKTTVTGLGVNKEDFPEISKLEALQTIGIGSNFVDVPVILSITRIIHRKGADLVLEALARFSEKHPNEDFLFLIGGKGPFEKTLIKLTEKLNLQSKVTFIGPYQYDKLHQTFRASDIFVMPSRSDAMDVEGYGIVFLEAGICGLPSIGSNSGGIPDAVEHNNSGFLVEEGSIDELEDKLTYLILNKNVRDKMGVNAKERALDMTWKHVAERILNRMKEISNA